MIDNLDQVPQLYRTLLARKSCRRFDSPPLNDQILQSVQTALEAIAPIQDGQHIQFLMLNELEKSRLAVAQGAYGRFIASPHLMVPYTENNSDALVELGFQSQQAVISLEEFGLASCYIGAHGRVRKLQQEFELSEDTHLAAVLIYGKPAPSPRNKNINRSLRSLIGSRKRKPAERILLDPTAQHSSLPSEWDAILEAGRWAPSATNAQPWRLLPIGNEFQLFTNPAAYPLVLSADSKLMYGLYDAGIFMANISLAAKAWDVQAHWRLHHETRVPNQKSLIPIARLSFS